MDFNEQIFFNLLLSLSFGVICAILAYQKKRSPIIWFFVGFFLVYIAFIILIFLSDGDAKETEAEAEERAKSEEGGKPEDVVLSSEERAELWFYLDKGGKQHGPVDRYSLSSLRDNDAVTDDSFVWREGMDEWRRIRDVPDLKDALPG